MTQSAPPRTRFEPMRPARVPQAEAGEPVLGLPLDRADAMLPADLLHGGEIIILILKPSPWFIILGCLGHLVGMALATIAVCALAELELAAGLARQDAALMGILSMLLRLGWQFLEWLSRIYVLTDRRVIRRMGVLRLFTFETPLKNIQHTLLIMTLRERLFGLGTIGFATSGTDRPEAFWVMLHRPAAIQRRIIAAINRYT